ncbi:MAG: type II toxin-antitoxin system VapC family toxin [Candidatus Paceibacteria bacterium]
MKNYMEKRIILDTSLWIARLCKKDRFHRRSLEVFEKLRHNYHILLPDYVLEETVSILLQIESKQKAEKFIDYVLKNENITLFVVDKNFLQGLFNFFFKSENEKLSFTDYVLFYLSEEYEVITFDQELQQAIKSK